MTASGTGLPGLNRVLIWFNDPGNWRGPGGLLAHLREHVVYTAVIVTISVVIAVPVGVWIGHTGRGVVLIGGVANALRAIPSLGLLVVLIVVLSPHIGVESGGGGVLPHGSVPYAVPALIVLLILAIPPILTSTYAGLQAVDRATRDAAVGTGMTAAQTALRVELPCALPVVVGGIRSATLQVIASLTVAALAVTVDAALNLVQRRVVSPGISGRYRRHT